MSYDEGQLNAGKQGSGSGLDADTVDKKEGNDLGNDLTPLNKSINDLFVGVAENQYANNLTRLNYDGGLFDIFIDNSKISSTSGGLIVNNLTAQDSRLDLGKKTETFEDETNGDTPPEWTGDTGSFTATNNTAAVGSLSGKLDYSGGSAVTYPFSSAVAPSEIVFYLRTGATGDNGNSYRYVDDNGNTIMGVKFGNGNSSVFDALDSSDTTIDGSPNDNKWYKIRFYNIDWQNETYDIDQYDINDNLLNSVSGINFSDSGSDINQFRIKNSMNGSSASCWVDNVYVRDTGGGSGSATTKSVDLSNDGFSSPPSSVVISQDAADIGDGDITYTVNDQSGNSVTINQSDVDSEVYLSAISDSTVDITIDMSPNSSGAIKLYSYSAYFKE